MIRQLKQAAALLPSGVREALQKWWHTLRYHAGAFVHDEPEFELLGEWVSDGDWVLDVGANIGIFSARLSKLVGQTGRVLAFEPVPATFRVLVHNSRLFPFSNVTAFNIAISSEPAVANMHIPTTATGLPALARAALTGPDSDTNAPGIPVVCLSLSHVDFPRPIKFIKIDVEGHEAQVLSGLTAILQRDQPRLLIEGQDETICQRLMSLGYRREVIQGSPNSIFHPITLEPSTHPDSTNDAH
jgi:FkbM family methyltransferase